MNQNIQVILNDDYYKMTEHQPSSTQSQTIISSLELLLYLELCFRLVDLIHLNSQFRQVSFHAQSLELICSSFNIMKQTPSQEQYIHMSCHIKQEAFEKFCHSPLEYFLRGGKTQDHILYTYTQRYILCTFVLSFLATWVQAQLHFLLFFVLLLTFFHSLQNVFTVV